MNSIAKEENRRKHSVKLKVQPEKKTKEGGNVQSPRGIWTIMKDLTFVLDLTSIRESVGLEKLLRKYSK